MTDNKNHVSDTNSSDSESTDMTNNNNDSINLTPEAADYTELMTTPLSGKTLVKVLAIKQGKQEGAFRIYGRAVITDDEGEQKLDPRNINLWYAPPRDPSRMKAYQARLGFLVQALGTAKYSDMPGRYMWVSLRSSDPQWNTYFADRTEKYFAPVGTEPQAEELLDDGPKRDGKGRFIG